MDVPGRTKTPIAVGEMDSLRAFLDFHRATLLWKLEGLSKEEATRPHVPSGTNLLGLVKHLTYVERYWFGIFFAGLDLPLPRFDEDPDAEWRVGPDETVEQVVAAYRAETERSRELVADASPDDRGRGKVVRRDGPASNFSLRWIMLHMIEETARHNGHADFLRELTDGTTGE
ncbi:MAG TPA: DinB family protein [Actinomycetes bacterium]